MSFRLRPLVLLAPVLVACTVSDPPMDASGNPVDAMTVTEADVPGDRTDGSTTQDTIVLDTFVEDASAADTVTTDTINPVNDATTVSDAGYTLSQDPAVGLSADFRAWLASHGYQGDDFARTDLSSASYGGRLSASEALRNEPVILIHGNSDRALGGSLGGWDSLVTLLRTSGYAPGEIYATTWGPADSTMATQQHHSRAVLTRLRRFVEAVLAYTGAAKVDVVAHSMGVTLGRKVIAGGTAVDPLTGNWDLGTALTTCVDTFVGIAGANQGLSSCYLASALPTCGAIDGLFPGSLVGTTVVGLSRLLDDLNQRPHTEGAFVYSVSSSADEIIGGGGLVWGRNTCDIPMQDGVLRYRANGPTHLELKAVSASAVAVMILAHRVP